MRHARKNRYSFLLLSALLVVLAGCGGGGSTATPVVSSSGSAGWVSVDPVSAPLTSPLVLGGTAWVSDHYVALHCAGLACLFDTSIDNYPGVDVTYVNLTTGETGNATSFYGGGTDWTHLWVATVSIVGGRNTIQVSAYDPSGAGASTTFDVYANLLTSIVVTPADPRIPKGASQQFTATGILTDSTTLGLTSQVTWTSSDASKATIDAAGTASGLAIGSTTITATWKGI